MVFCSFQRKMIQEMRKMTTLELKISSQKSRILELEGSLEMAEESANNMRKEQLMLQDKFNHLTRKVSLTFGTFFCPWYLFSSPIAEAQ